MTVTPHCIRCGHEPCPYCIDWCDRILWNIYCPACDEVVEKKTKRHQRGDHTTCPHCGHDWKLRLWSEDSEEGGP
jgi:rRNA maturation endonuclease Nob1